jgi:hypothetical protein
MDNDVCGEITGAMTRNRPVSLNVRSSEWRRRRLGSSRNPHLVPETQHACRSRPPATYVAFDRPEEAAVCGGMMGAAINVGEVYAHLARDLMEGSYTTPGFDHALHNARLIEAVARAADRGMRQKLGQGLYS